MFATITSGEIRRALEQVSRQYLAEQLSARLVAHYDTSDLNRDHVLFPMMRASSRALIRATRYQYMLSDWTQYLNTDTGGEYRFRAGDFYVIEPGTTAFSARSGGADPLHQVPSTAERRHPGPDVEAWLASALTTTRVDYSAPMRRRLSIVPAAAVAIEHRALLMLQRRDSGVDAPGTLRIWRKPRRSARSAAQGRATSTCR